MSKKFSEFTPVASPAGASEVVGYLGGTNTRQRLDSLPVSNPTQTALNLKANSASPTLTGVPAAPTAAPGTNTTQIATTAFVLANAGGAVDWGDIGGVLVDQTDLQAALDLKANAADTELTGALFFDTDSDGLAFNSNGAQVLNVDEVGFQLRRPLIEVPRVVTDSDSPTVALTDLVIDYQRTDAAPVVVPDPASASIGQHLKITNSSAASVALNGAVASSYFNGSAGVVSSITLASNETIFFQLLSGKWRVLSRYLTTGTLASLAGTESLTNKKLGSLTTNGFVKTSGGDGTLSVDTTSYIPVAGTGMPVVIQIAASDTTTPITAGNGKVTFRMPFAMTLTAVRASDSTAPTGSSIVIDINESGTTVLSTKLSIDATEKTSTTAATPPVISDSALADDAEMTIDFDQVGSTIAGVGVIVTLIGTRT